MIFVIRNPVDRMYSYYKQHFLLKYDRYNVSFDEYILPAFEKTQKFTRLRELMLENADLKTVIELFYQSPFIGDAELALLFSHSFYAPVIGHYINILGECCCCCCSDGWMDAWDG